MYIVALEFRHCNYFVDLTKLPIGIFLKFGNSGDAPLPTGRLWPNNPLANQGKTI